VARRFEAAIDLPHENPRICSKIERFPHSFTTRFAECSAKLWCVSETLEAIRECPWIAGWNEEAGALVRDELRYSTEAARHDRETAHHRFHQRDRNSLAAARARGIAGEHGDVGSGYDAPHLVTRASAVELHAIREAELGRFALHLAGEWASTDQVARHLHAAIDQQAARVEQERVTFDIIEGRHADDP
jgi:hypothetical protein